jgi:hypothetical protein
MAVHSHRHKRHNLTTSKTRKQKDKLAAAGAPAAGGLPKVAGGSDFDMDIDMPLGNSTAPAAGATTTVTGPISTNSDVVIQVWYTDSSGNITALDASLISYSTGATQDQPFQWNYPLALPAALAPGDYTFYIQATYSPSPAPGGSPILLPLSALATAFSTITLSAPFTI